LQVLQRLESKDWKEECKFMERFYLFIYLLVIISVLFKLKLIPYESLRIKKHAIISENNLIRAIFNQLYKTIFIY
jgi:hypothetical protein